MNKFMATAALLAASLAVAHGAKAQEREYGPWVFTVEGGALAQSEADFKDVDGAFSLSRWFMSAGIDYLWDTRNMLGVSVGGGSTDFDFDDGMGLPVDGPWGKIKDYRVSINGRFSFGEKGTAFVIPTVRHNYESGASASDGRTWGLLGGVAWTVSDDLTIGPGIGWFERLSDSSRVFPILIIDWNISERWNLSTGRGLAASQGPGLTLSYQLNDAWSLGVAGRYEQVDFRLRDDGPVPGGVGRDETLPLVLSADWNPNPGMSLSVFAGSEFGGKLELLDARGDLVEETEYDPSFILGGTFRLRF